MTPARAVLPDSPALAPPRPDGLAYRAFQLLEYFDHFDHPLRVSEFRRLLGEADLSPLIREGRARSKDGFYFLPGRDWIVEKRLADEARLKDKTPALARAAAVIASFPFVRGLLLTGSAGKGVLPAGADFDFLVLCAPGRVWLCRLLFSLLKKAVSLDHRNGLSKMFCCNYIVAEDSLAVLDENPFIALEILTSRPLYNAGLFAEFLKANAWTTRYFPWASPSASVCDVSALGPLKTAAEAVLNLVWGSWAENRVREWFFRRWTSAGVFSRRDQFEQRAGLGAVKTGGGRRQEYLAGEFRNPGGSGHQSGLRTQVRLKALSFEAGLQDGPEILLTHSYLLNHFKSDRKAAKPYLPLGPLCLAGHLRARGFRPALFDPTFDKNLNRFRRALRETRAPLAGVYAQESTRASALEIIRACGIQGVPIIAGGPDPSLRPEIYLNAGAHAVVVGEGEKPVAELLEHVRSGHRLLEEIEGLCLDGRSCRISRPLPTQELAWPARDLADLGPYLKAWKKAHGFTSLSLMASRGCPYECSWCSKPVFGNRYRVRPAQDVAAEMEFLARRYAPDQFWFADDIFGLDSQWLAEFHQAVLAKGLKIPFEILSRVDTVSRAKLELLRQAGCVRVWYGAESGSPAMLEKMRLGFTLEQTKAAVAATRAAGLEVGFFILIGHPEETVQDLDQTRRLLRETLPDRMGLSLVHPFPGTAFFEEVQDRMKRPARTALANSFTPAFRSRYPAYFYQLAAKLMGKELLVRRGAAGALNRVKLGILDFSFKVARRAV